MLGKQKSFQIKRGSLTALMWRVNLVSNSNGSSIWQRYGCCYCSNRFCPVVFVLAAIAGIVVWCSRRCSTWFCYFWLLMLFSCWCCICCNPSTIFVYLVAESYVYDVLVVVAVCCLLLLLLLLFVVVVAVCCCCLLLLLLLFVFKSFDAGVVLCRLLAPGPLSRASLVGLCPDFNADSNIYVTVILENQGV